MTRREPQVVICHPNNAEIARSMDVFADPRTSLVLLNDVPLNKVFVVGKRQARSEFGVGIKGRDHRVRCSNTVHSNYLTDHRCQLAAGHDGGCLFGDLDRIIHLNDLLNGRGLEERGNDA